LCGYDDLSESCGGAEAVDHFFECLFLYFELGIFLLEDGLVLVCLESVVPVCSSGGGEGYQTEEDYRVYEPSSEGIDHCYYPSVEVQAGR